MLLSAAIVPPASEAQTPNSGARNLAIGYQPGNASQNGYADAQLRLKYWIAACSSGPSLLMQAEPSAHMLVGPHRYWVDGRQVQVPPHIAPPKVSDVPTVRGTVRGRGVQKDVSYLYTTVAPNAPDCWFNDVPFAKAEDLWKKGATNEEKTAALKEVAFHPSGQFGPLRNSQVEEHFRAIWKKERSDSIARAQAEAQAKREEERKKAEAEEAERKRLAAAEREKAAEAEQKAAAQRKAEEQEVAAKEQAQEAERVAEREQAQEAERRRAEQERSARETEELERRGAESRARVWALAEDFYRTQEYDQARPYYQQLANDMSESNTYRLRAQQRLSEIHAQQMDQAAEAMAEALVPAAMLVGEGLGAIFEGLEGTGFLLGASYQASPFPDDQGAVGLTMGFHIREFDFPVSPYLEMGFGLGSSTEAEHFGQSYAAGAALVRYGKTIGGGIPVISGLWAPHVGFRHVATSRDWDEYGDFGRGLNLGMLGLMGFHDQSYLRLDAVLISGKPSFGAAFGILF